MKVGDMYTKSEAARADFFDAFKHYGSISCRVRSLFLFFLLRRSHRVVFNDGTPRAMQTLEGVRVKDVALRRRSGRNPGSAAVSERPHSL